MVSRTILTLAEIPPSLPNVPPCPSKHRSLVVKIVSCRLGKQGDSSAVSFCLVLGESSELLVCFYLFLLNRAVKNA